MWISSCSHQCWKGYSSSIKWSWYLCQKSIDCMCMVLFLDSQFYLVSVFMPFPLCFDYYISMCLSSLLAFRYPPSPVRKFFLTLCWKIPHVTVNLWPHFCSLGSHIINNYMITSLVKLSSFSRYTLDVLHLLFITLCPQTL